MFLLKNRPKTMQNRPKSHPTMFLLHLLYKTVLWCFLFDFMLISNGTGHSFIVFLYIKEEIYFFEYFRKTCKKPVFKQNFSLFKVNFGRFFNRNIWSPCSKRSLDYFCCKKLMIWQTILSGPTLYFSVVNQRPVL